MKRLKRIVYAFRRAFWAAWMEVPPQEMRRMKVCVGEISINTRQAELDLDHLVQRIKQAHRDALGVKLG